MRAPSAAPAPALTTRYGAGTPRALAALLPDPTCPKQNPKADGEKAPRAWKPENKARPAHLASHNAGPRAADPPPPPCPAPLPREAPRPPRHQEQGRRLRTPTRAARPRVRREGARHKAPRAPGGMEGGRGRGAPAAPSRTARGLLRAGPPRSRAGACGSRCPREGAAAPVPPRAPHPPHLRAERDGSGGAASPQGPADEKRLTQRRAQPPATYIRRAAYPSGRGPASQRAALALIRMLVGPQP